MRAGWLPGRAYGSLVVALCLVAAGALAIVSCGSESSNGGLCEQCGPNDGPCQDPFFVEPGPNAPAPCNAEGAPNPCEIELTCRRKVDSAQQRCFPLSSDPQYRCDGERAGVTAAPQPTLTATPSPTTTPTPTSTASAAPVCGDGEVDGDEDCDGTNLDGEDCDSLCDNSLVGDVLQCTSFCRFDFSGCRGGGCSAD